MAALDPRPTAGCPIERALLVLDGKWSVLIIRDLLSGPKRFTELRTSLGIGSPKTLTERLRILEHRASSRARSTPRSRRAWSTS